VFRFINDSNILIYSKTIEENCRALERAHKVYIMWARRYRVVFAPKKYYLIYFIRSYKKFNIKAIVNISSFIEGLISILCILGV
jgi:hypothetical protein